MTAMRGWPLVVAFVGVVAARIGYAPFEFRQAMLMLVTGWIVTFIGYVAGVRAPWSRIGALLVLSALAWYLPAFRWVALDVAAAAAGGLELAWAAVMGHALLTYPSGRIVGRVQGVQVAGLYAASLVPPPLGPPLFAMLLVVALLLRRPPGQRLPMLWAGFSLAAIVALERSLVEPLRDVELDTRQVVQVAYMAIAALVGGQLVSRSARRARTADLLVDVGSSPVDGLEARLAESLDDPSVRLGIWLPADGRYVDPEGRAVEPPVPSANRSVTYMATHDRPIAFLAHAAPLGRYSELQGAIARLTALSAAHAGLQADLRGEIDAVRASRRRLLRAADDARDEIGRRLDQAVRPSIDAVHRVLDTAPGSDAIRRLLDGATADLARTLEGLLPALLDERGLEGAIRALAARSGMPVLVDIDLAVAPGLAVQRDLVFIASEALSNVGKHASATYISLTLRDDATSLTMEVVDDGLGGAELRPQGGLLGIRDRVETVGGTLDILSHLGSGTRLRIMVPLVVPDDRLEVPALRPVSATRSIS